MDLVKLIVFIFIIGFMGSLIGLMVWRDIYERRHQPKQKNSDKEDETDM